MMVVCTIGQSRAITSPIVQLNHFNLIWISFCIFLPPPNFKRKGESRRIFLHLVIHLSCTLIIPWAVKVLFAFLNLHFFSSYIPSLWGQAQSLLGFQKQQNQLSTTPPVTICPNSWKLNPFSFISSSSSFLIF